MRHSFSSPSEIALNILTHPSYSVLDHNHSGIDINSGVIDSTFIDPLISRDAEIMPLVLGSDGQGSGLDADFLDGQSSATFASSTAVNSLDIRVSTLESESGGSQDPVITISIAARVVSEQTFNRTPELERWFRAARDGVDMPTSVDTMISF